MLVFCYEGKDLISNTPVTLNLAWFRWQDGTNLPSTPPAVGETVTTNGARFTMR
jgi:hypothetical protein